MLNPYTTQRTRIERNNRDLKRRLELDGHADASVGLGPQIEIGVAKQGLLVQWEVRMKNGIVANQASETAHVVLYSMH